MSSVAAASWEKQGTATSMAVKKKRILMPQAYVCLVLFASPNIWKGESGLDPFYRRRMISPEPTMQRISEGDKQDTGNLGVVIENDTPLCRHVLLC